MTLAHESHTVLDSSELPSHALPFVDELPTINGETLKHPDGQSSNLISATITAAASLFSPEQVQFLIIDTSGRDVFGYLDWLPHCAAVHNVTDSASARTARDTVAGLLDSREDDLPEDSKVYVIVNGTDDPRAYPELDEAMERIVERGPRAGVWLVRSRC